MVCREETLLQKYQHTVLLGGAMLFLFLQLPLTGNAQTPEIEKILASLEAEVETKNKQLRVVTAKKVESINACELNRPLFLGDTGEDVACLQEFLRDQGFYNFPINTGYYGPQTRAGVRQWQRNEGVALAQYDGYFGPQSQSHFKKHTQRAMTAAAFSARLQKSRDSNKPEFTSVSAMKRVKQLEEEALIEYKAAKRKGEETMTKEEILKELLLEKGLDEQGNEILGSQKKRRTVTRTREDVIETAKESDLTKEDLIAKQKEEELRKKQEAELRAKKEAAQKEEEQKTPQLFQTKLRAQ